MARDGSGGQEVRHLLADHLGSTWAGLDGGGNVVAHFEYGPYGKSRAAGTAATRVRYRYTGHPWDESQGVYETPARGYDPTQGRFLSVDPQRQGASPYVYAGNNPILYRDPNGKGRVGTVVTPELKSLARQLAAQSVKFDSTTRFISKIEDPAVRRFFQQLSDMAFSRVSYGDRTEYHEMHKKISTAEGDLQLRSAFRSIRETFPSFARVNHEQMREVASQMGDFHRIITRMETAKASHAKAMSNHPGNKEDYFKSELSWKVASGTDGSASESATGYGNCVDVATCIGGQLAAFDPEVNVEIFHAGVGVSHTFVVVGRNPKTDSTKPGSWNDEAIIVDGWAGDGIVEPAREYYVNRANPRYFHPSRAPHLSYAFD